MRWLRRRSSLKVFVFLALAAILFNGAEWFEQFLNKISNLKFRKKK